MEIRFYLLWMVSDLGCDRAGLRYRCGVDPVADVSTKANAAGFAIDTSDGTWSCSDEQDTRLAYATEPND